jgi:hypothetical protein
LNTLTDARKKHLYILKSMYSGDQTQIEMASRALSAMEEEERAVFNQFQVDVGNIFIEVKEELDQGLEDMADACPEEPDPRKWDGQDWQMFYAAVEGHKYEQIYRLYAAQLPNIQHIWREIDSRLDLGD